MNCSRIIRLLLGGFLVCLALGSLLIVTGQSGRRVRQPPPVATSEPTPVPSPEKKVTLVKFVIGVDKYNGFSTIPLQYYDSVRAACRERLDQGSGVKAEIDRKEMTRGDALNQAKASKDTYVVWLRIRIEGLSDDVALARDLTKVYLEYSLFAPTTAKQLAYGRTYQSGVRKGDVSVGGPSAGRGNVGVTEYLLKESAREAAERILTALKIGTGTKTPGVP